MAIIYVETRSKNLPDSGAWQIHKFGSASGEQRIALEGNWETDKNLFDFYVKDVEFYFFTKSDMLDYISSIEEEICYPTQNYRCKNYPEFYENKKQEIIKFPSEFIIMHFEANPRSGGTPYIATISGEDCDNYNFLRSICLSSMKQGKNNAYTTFKFVKYQDTKTKKFYINLVPTFSKKYTMKELSHILERELQNADDIHVALNLFGLKYAEQILSAGYDCKELLEMAGSEDNDLIAELETVLEVFAYLKENKLTINPISDKVGLLGSYIEEKPSNLIHDIDTSSLPLQQIFYGAPGTGKSHTIEKCTGNQPKENVFRTTFHPDSDYSTFVGSYKPSMKPATAKQAILDYDGLVDKFKEYLSADNNITRACTKFGFDFHDSIVKMQEDNAHSIPLLVADAYKSGTTYDTQVRAGMSVYETSYNESNVEDKIVYSYIPQAFTKAYIRAWQTTDPVFLIIEEINRGNCAQIFGDLFQLLDRKNNVSEYPIKPDTDLGKYISDTFVKEGCIAPQDSPIFKGNELKLPANLYIWATMNTSDQSLFPIDSAFKRRWDWRYIKIAQPKKDGTDEKFNWKIEGDIDWWQFIKKVNDIIQRMTNSADKQLGYFFAKANNEDVITYDCFVSKVCFYLWNDIFKTYAMDGTENSLFKYTYIDEDDSSEKTGVLDFTKFFDEEGKVVPAVVLQFIENVMNWQGETK